MNWPHPWISHDMLVLLIGGLSCTLSAPGQDIKMLDADVQIQEQTAPVVSPDGNLLAYASKGFVHVCQIETGTTKRIFQLPTWRYLIDLPEHALGDRSFQAVVRGLTKEAYHQLLATATVSMWSFHWTRAGTGLIFAVGVHDPVLNKAHPIHYYVGLDGTSIEVKPDLANARRARGLTGAPSVTLTSDRKYLVFNPTWIWDIAAGKPRAACFDVLVPSSTSDRWLAVEKDTRQLLILDQNLRITKRFEPSRAVASDASQLLWSPDERFVIWRNQVGVHSLREFSGWEGSWIDLVSGEQRRLVGRGANDQLAFTGRGGEYVSFSYLFGDEPATIERQAAAQLSLIAEATGEPRTIWHSDNVHVSHALQFRASQDNRLFAIAVPRPLNERPGQVWHLVDLENNLWRFPVEDNGQYVSPFELVDFASKDQVVIGYNPTSIFAVPVSDICLPRNLVK